MKEFTRYLIKNKISAISLSLLISFLVFCLVMAIKPKKEFFFLLPEQTYTQDDAGEILLQSGISLTPGTWSFKAEYSADEEDANYFTIKDTETKESLLWYNYANAYSGLTEVSFTVYAFANTDSVEFFANHQKGNLSVNSLTVSETPLFWTRLAVITTAVLFVVIYFFSVLFKIKNNQLSRDKLTAIVFVNLIWIIASISLFQKGIIIGGDLVFHLLRIDGIKEAIVNGIFPVKLEPQWQQGFGYADAVFYCPFFLYIPALFELAGFYIGEVVVINYVLLNIATAWVAYYCYSEIAHDKKAGIIATAVYVFSIYRVNTLYAIGMIGVGTAMVFLPLILLSIKRLIFDDREGRFSVKDWLPLAIGFVGVIQCHVLSSEITFFLTLVTCLVHVIAIIKRKAISSFFKAVAVAVGLCIWFLVPFLDYYLSQDIIMKHSGARQIQSQGYYLAQHMILFANNKDFPGTQFSHTFGIGFFPIIVLMVLFALWYTGVLRQRLEQDLYKFVKYSLVASAVLFFMTLNIFPWDKLQRVSSIIEPLIGNIQYPHRFQAWIFVFVSALIGILYKYVVDLSGKMGRYMVLGSIVLYVVLSFGWLQISQMGVGRISLYNIEGMQNGYTAGDQYSYVGTDPDKFIYGTYNTGEGVILKEENKGALRASVICENSTEKESWIEFPLVNYKEYIAKSGKEKLKVVSGDNFVVRVIVPPHFSGEINVRFVKQWYWIVAEIISAFFYWALIGYGINVYVKSKRKVQK